MHVSGRLDVCGLLITSPAVVVTGFGERSCSDCTVTGFG